MNYEHTKQWRVLSIDDSIKTIKFTYRLVGLNLEERKRKFSDNFKFWFVMIWLHSSLLFCGQWLWKNLLEGDNLTEFFFVAPGACFSIIGSFKGALAFIHEDKMKALVENLRKLGENVEMVKINMKESRKIESHIRFLNRVMKTLIILNVLILLFFGLTPIWSIAVKYYRTRELELILPFLDIYTFDSSNLRYWPFLYIHQMGTQVIVILQIYSADFFFYICCTYIKIQFKLLQLKLTNIISEHETEDSVELRRNFAKLIKWHQEIIGAASSLEIITSKATLSNFVTSSVVICLTGFNIANSVDFSAIMIFMTFLFISLLQVFFLCLFGDMLVESSFGVSDAAYSCYWYLADVSIKKTVLLIQTRAQTPCKLSAAGFADVNLIAYMGILSTSWSYFALLNTLYGSSRT